ncbi:MAG: chromosomal replication initiator protein DnaA, partial [Treponemataceae bacterium]
SIAVSKNPGKAYNPLLIYGGVGLGKTHLMQSIGNLAYNEDKKKIIYVTAETFTNEFIESVRTQTTTKFKNKYRNADFLLIDDIHFLQKKPETQEELFHTFNALYDSYKQLVFTCDRPVSELKDMSDRLRSRFERGLNVDLQPPNFETRKAILKSKTKLHNIAIPDEVIDLIAQKIETNVRDLEACLTKLVAYADLIHKDITLEIAQHQLRDAFGSPKQGNITIEDIQKVVSNHYNISYNDLKGKGRKKNIVFPRQLAMYITREITEYSTTEIGSDFGGRDHTTVIHSCSKIEDASKLDSSLYSLIQNLIKKVKDFKK